MSADVVTIAGRHRTWRVSPNTTSPDAASQQLSTSPSSHGWDGLPLSDESESEDEGPYMSRLPVPLERVAGPAGLQISPVIDQTACDSAAWSQLMACASLPPAFTSQPDAWYSSSRPAAGEGLPITPPQSGDRAVRPPVTPPRRPPSDDDDEPRTR